LTHFLKQDVPLSSLHATKYSNNRVVHTTINRILHKQRFSSYVVVEYASGEKKTWSKNRF